jgi:heterodisulfide reductase subunit B
LLDVLLFFLPIPERTSSAVRNPLTSLKGVGYVGCQTVRPFAASDGGGKYDTYDQPEFLDDFPEFFDDFVKACGAEAVEPAPISTSRSCSIVSSWPLPSGWMQTGTPRSTTTKSSRSSWWN